jgi:hypothetical protein
MLNTAVTVEQFATNGSLMAAHEKNAQRHQLSLSR